MMYFGFRLLNFKIHCIKPEIPQLLGAQSEPVSRWPQGLLPGNPDCVLNQRDETFSEDQEEVPDVYLRFSELHLRTGSATGLPRIAKQFSLTSSGGSPLTETQSVGFDFGSESFGMASDTQKPREGWPKRSMGLLELTYITLDLVPY